MLFLVKMYYYSKLNFQNFQTVMNPFLSLIRQNKQHIQSLRNQ